MAVTIPLQDVPLRVKLHVSGVPRDQYITATIVSGPPSNIVVEEEPADHSAVRQAPFVEDRKENAQTESRSKAVEQAPSRPVTVATAAKDHYTGVEESIYPVEMSGALGEFLNSLLFKGYAPMANFVCFSFKEIIPGHHETFLEVSIGVLAALSNAAACFLECSISQKEEIAWMSMDELCQHLDVRSLDYHPRLKILSWCPVFGEEAQFSCPVQVLAMQDVGLGMLLTIYRLISLQNVQIQVLLSLVP